MNDNEASRAAARPAAGQHWSAERYAGNARFVADLGLPVLDLLAPQPGERILDLGCGDGALSERIVAAGASVLGFDASRELLDAARQRGLEVVEGDGHELPFDGEFDAVFSNAALHWMLRPAKVVEGVRRALRPGGRFVGEFGGFGNIAAIATALRAVLNARGVDTSEVAPWYYPTPKAYGALLESHGFSMASAELIPRPTPLPTGMAGWLDTFGEPYLRHLPAGERAAALEEAVNLLAPALRDEQGGWIADYVRLRFKAVLA